jgi:hypothetical protein
MLDLNPTRCCCTLCRKYMRNSFAKTLASGSQDLGALARLFCTDGVERNALAIQSGYFTGVSSIYLFRLIWVSSKAVLM